MFGFFVFNIIRTIRVILYEGLFIQSNCNKEIKIKKKKKKKREKKKDERKNRSKMLLEKEKKR